MNRRSLIAAAACGLPMLAVASPVSDALQRPALRVRQPERTVLLALAQAGQRLVAVGERGVVALSDDHGASWRQARCPVSVTLTMVRFADARHGMAVGHGGAVVTTADGGETWALRLDGRQVAALARAAATTPEAVKEAERLLADGPDKPFLDLILWDARRALVVGAYGLAVHTADGGATWTSWSGRLPNPKALHWYVARRSGDTLLLAGEQGLLARSDDGGATFKAMLSPYKGSWFAGEVSGEGRMVLAGLRGNVWRSADGGGTWAAVPLPVPASITALLALPGDELLLASQAGTLLRVRGDTVSPVAGAPVPLPASLLAGHDGVVLAAGAAGIVRLPAVAPGASR